MKILATFCQIAGVLGILAAIFFAGDVLTHLPTDYSQPQRINCYNNLEQIGLAFKTWALEHHDQFPFNVSTNNGGSMELCARSSDGFDSNAAAHFQVLSNELVTPSVLICPGDPSRKAALNFQNIQATNLSYRMRSGTNIDQAHLSEILLMCPIDGNILHCDGSVTLLAEKGTPSAAIPDLWRYHAGFRHAAAQALASLAAAVLSFAVGCTIKNMRKHKS